MTPNLNCFRASPPFILTTRRPEKSAPSSAVPAYETRTSTAALWAISRVIPTFMISDGSASVPSPQSALRAGRRSKSTALLASPPTVTTTALGWKPIPAGGTTSILVSVQLE